MAKIANEKTNLKKYLEVGEAHVSAIYPGSIHIGPEKRLTLGSEDMLDNGTIEKIP
ncbi:predicted protein [Botrytis cinerea T4]|uniref:Uncharacterized protein n=1 Tax=Botryotinia fuckeliana (strain T4) TaxID=999810 RepID=G2XNI6_BOTF4|nr:predicted protein [Botrytis cinerea T4]